MHSRERLLVPSSQLTAGYWQNGCCPVRCPDGWLVSRVCRVSVCLSAERAARPECVCRAQHGRRA